MANPRRSPRFSHSLLGMVVFLLGSALLIGFVAYHFLIPAMQVAQDATVSQKRQLVAYSRLLLAIVLVIVCIGFLFIFRIGRFFFPRSAPPRQKTQYIDVWAEAGRRAPTPPAEDEQE